MCHKQTPGTLRRSEILPHGGLSNDRRLASTRLMDRARGTGNECAIGAACRLKRKNSMSRCASLRQIPLQSLKLAFQLVNLFDEIESKRCPGGI